MAVFGAILAYVMQMAAFILLRRNAPGLLRPYVSPLGTPGAVIAALLAAATLAALFLNPDCRIGVLGASAWFVVGLLYFALHARKRLILSPEEKFAVSMADNPGNSEVAL